MPAIDITDRYQAVQFSGSNASEIAALISDYSFVSLSGGVLEFTTGGSNRTVATTEWVRAVAGNYSGTFSNSSFGQYFVRNAIYGELSDLIDRVDVLEASPAGIQAAGIALAPTLLLSSSSTVPVDFAPAMPDTSYTANVQLIASTTALGSLSVTSVSNVDTNTVNVTVQNSGLVNLSGVQILVAVSA